MELIADLHLHSKYSRAVSKYMDLPEIARHASWKGIDLVATGDWQHPAWFADIGEQLKEVAAGVYELKSSPVEARRPVRFLLGTEVSCIYSQGGKGRRIHHLIFSPSLEVCARVIEALQKRGVNLLADGRPILGMSSHDLLEMLLAIDANILLIPAHVWTPWFGMFGSKSGFDSIEECFGDLSSHIYAVETGLSSDPRMNWQIAELENRQIVSFSDAHSGPKLGREATVFKSKDEDFSYADIVQALKGEKGKMAIDRTLEFFPEEGKYHWTGHRACGVCYSPAEERVKGLVCPVCGRQLTSGVEHRVEELSGQDIELQFKVGAEKMVLAIDPAGNRKPFVSVIPLLEILQEILKSPTKAKREYFRLVERAPEFDILLNLGLEDLEKLSGPELAKAIEKMRRREVSIQPGFDGEFGKVSLA